MVTIVVASKNPVKVQAVLEGFSRMFPGEELSLLPISVPSGVSDQPYSSPVTLQGALNRVYAAREAVPQADFWVGIEGGVEDAAVHEGHPDPILENRAADRDSLAHGSSPPWLCAFAWAAVLSDQMLGKGRTGTLYLPPQVAELVRQGMELGEADDIVFGRSNSKQENGAVGLLTGDVVDRAAFYIHAVILALIPFKNPSLYEMQQ